MKRIFISFALGALAFFTCNAEEKTSNYKFGDITSINVSSNINIHVTEGQSGKVKVVYDKKMDEYQDIKVRYHGETLDLSVKRKTPTKGWTNDNKIHVYIEMDEICSINLSGAAKATFSGDFKTDELDIDISGAASLSDLNINGKALEIDISGAGKGAVTGNFSQKVEVDLSGAAKLMLAGKTAYAEYNGSGACNIDAQELYSETAEVEFSGACKVKVHASNELHYDVSPGSKMTYFGEAELFNHNSATNIVKGR